MDAFGFPFLQPQSYVPIWFMSDTSSEPAAILPTTNSCATRHNGWTGEKMAIFCEALAETARERPAIALLRGARAHARKDYDLCDLSQYRGWQ